jgi:uncharacterized protein YutE (UPF0331/DUF86 family)
MTNPDSETGPDYELRRDLFARFGLAYYHSECLHRELCIMFTCSELPPPSLITQSRVEELMSRAFSLTLGEVVLKLEGVLPDELWKNVRAALERRNFLAHHFWFERVHLMFNVRDTRLLIAQLDDDIQLYDTLDTRVSEYSRTILATLGVTAEMQADSLNRVIAGEDDDPLPDKQAIRELDRRLRGKQRLVRVWEFKLEEGGRPLIFELADGSLWQLSDVGLGFTRFQEIDKVWIENSAIKQYLPADIQLRPKTDRPWKYEWNLANGTSQEE